MSQDVFQIKMDIIMEQSPGEISNHNDTVTFGVTYNDHAAKLINMWNMAKKKGPVLKILLLST